MSQNLLRGFTNPDQKVNYNAFDRSYHNPYTCKVGQVIPVAVIHTDPGDKIRASVASMIRTNPLTTAAMLRAKVVYEWYFTPYSQLNHNWNSLFGKINEFQSADSQNVFEQADVELPYFDLAHLLKAHQTDSSIKNVFGKDIRGDVSKLVDMLDCGSYELKDVSGTKTWVLPNLFTTSSTSGHVSVDINPFVFQAYQKIWNCYHRNKYYDPINSSASKGYNTDDIALGTGNVPNILSQRTGSGVYPEQDVLSNMLCLRYHGWKRDQFLSAMPTRQDGVVSSISLEGVRINSSVSQSDLTDPVTSYRAGISSGGYPTPSLVLRDQAGNVVTGSGSWIVPNAFDVLTIRQAEALQRWKETTLRAGKNINKQFKGHTGFTPKFAMDNYPEFIGSFDSNISVDEVMSNSDTLTQGASGIEGAQLGQIAGKGISVTGRNEIKYFARDHGILMCVAYIIPEVPYNATGINPFNTKLKRSDYFMKEFENTGLVPVTRKEVDISQVNNASQLNTILGYLPFAYEYKSNYDRVHGELIYNRSLRAWTPSRSDVLKNLNAFSALGGFNKAIYYINPSIMDDIFAVAADETEATDQFIINHYNDIKVLSNKSVLGLPQF